MLLLTYNAAISPLRVSLNYNALKYNVVGIIVE